MGLALKRYLVWDCGGDSETPFELNLKHDDMSSQLMLGMALSTRFILGLLCGLLGPIKALAREVCRPEHQAIGNVSNLQYYQISTSWAVGLVVGPAIGGFFPEIYLSLLKNMRQHILRDLYQPNLTSTKLHRDVTQW